MNVHPDISVKQEGSEIIVERSSDDKNHRALHGLTRALINNMVVGVSDGFSKNLEINGVGYKAVKQGNKVVFSLGYSHTIEMVEPEGISIDVSRITLSQSRALISSSLARHPQRSVLSEFLMFIRQGHQVCR